MMYRKLLFIVLVIVLFFGGIAGGVVMVFCLHLYPLPMDFSWQPGNDSSLKIARFAADERPLIGNKDGFIIIEFKDWKNDGPYKKVIVNAKGHAEARLFYNDSEKTIAIVDSNLIYIYDKKTQGITSHDFGIDYHLITPTLDAQHFIAYKFGAIGKISLLDFGGRILMEHILGEEGQDLQPMQWQFLDKGNKLVFLTTNPDPQTPGKIFTWDLRKNKLTEDARPEVKNAMQFSWSQMLVQFDNEKDAVYLDTSSNSLKAHIKVGSE